MSPLASQCAQHCSAERNFADSGKMCSGVVILGLGLALVLAKEMQDNRPPSLIHVRLAHHVYHYNHRICRPRFFISGGTWRTLLHENPCLIRILEFCEKWSVDKSTLTLIFKPLLVLQTQLKYQLKEKWTHYNTVKFKCL